MISDPNLSDEEIVSFVDGELDAERSLVIETALIGDEKLQQRVNEFRKTKELLKEAFAIADMDTPPHIMAQIDEMDPSPSKKMELERGHSFLHKFFMSFRIQYAIPAAAFSLGLFLNPVLIPSSNEGSVNEFLSGQLDEIALRGSEITSTRDYLAALPPTDLKNYMNLRGIQGGNQVYSGGILRANMEFTILLTAPVDGQATLSERDISGTEQVAATVDIYKDQYVAFPIMQVDDQPNLSLVIRLQGEDIQISQTLDFNIQN